MKVMMMVSQYNINTNNDFIHIYIKRSKNKDKNNNNNNNNIVNLYRAKEKKRLDNKDDDVH